MQMKTISSRDELPLTYYVCGTTGPALVVVNPPGMGMRFWLPIIRRLDVRCRIFAFEYRGFPALDRVLTKEQASFAHCLDDLMFILKAERLEYADFVAWCGGVSLVLALHERRPSAVRSLVAVGVTMGENNHVSPFVATMNEIRQMVEEDPNCVQRVVLRMNRIGLIRDCLYFEAIYRNGPSADPNGIDTLEQHRASAMSGFTLFDSPAGLLSYLALFHEFNLNDRPLHDIDRPVTLINSRRGSPNSISDTMIGSTDSRDVWELTLEQQSEFLLLERADEIADIVVAHLERPNTQRERRLKTEAERSEVGDGP